MRGGFSRYIGPGLEEPSRDPRFSEGPHSLNSHGRLNLMWRGGGVFSTQILNQFWEKSQSVPRIPKQSRSTLQTFSWRPWLSTKYHRSMHLLFFNICQHFRYICNRKKLSVPEWVSDCRFYTKMINVSTISWWEQITFDDMMMMSALY